MKKLQKKLEFALPWALLIFLAGYTFLFLFSFPYLGFQFTSTTGRVNEIYVEQGARNSLEIGDQILSIGDVSLEDYSKDLSAKFPLSSAYGGKVDIRFL
jgi:hypothetical protein